MAQRVYTLGILMARKAYTCGTQLGPVSVHSWDSVWPRERTTRVKKNEKSSEAMRVNSCMAMTMHPPLTRVSAQPASKKNLKILQGHECVNSCMAMELHPPLTRVGPYNVNPQHPSPHPFCGLTLYRLKRGGEIRSKIHMENLT